MSRQARRTRPALRRDRLDQPVSGRRSPRRRTHGLVAVAGIRPPERDGWDRRWDAPPGANLLVSVLLRPPADHVSPEDSSRSISRVQHARSPQLTPAGTSPGWTRAQVAERPRRRWTTRSSLGVLAEAVGWHPATGARWTPAVVVGLGLNVGWPGPGADAAADELRSRPPCHRLQDKPSGATSDCDLLLEGRSGAS